MYHNRIKTKSVDIDFPEVIHAIRHKGYSYAQISDIIGCDKTHLCNIANDSFPTPTAWHQAAKLIDLYMMVCKDL